MLILAVETVTRRGSIAVGTGHGGDARARAGVVGLTHAERLPGELIDWLAVLKAAGVKNVRLDQDLPFLGTLIKKEQDIAALNEAKGGVRRWG